MDHKKVVGGIKVFGCLVILINLMMAGLVLTALALGVKWLWMHV